jgi:ABC-2 type transport system ATP-binding protein
MLGLLRADQGQATLFGEDPKSPGNRQRVSAMLQISGVPDTLKVRELIELFSSYYPNPLAYKEVVQAASLTELEDRLVGKLSGGQRQRLMFGLAICGNPDLVFLDEPTVGLDVESRHAFWNFIRRFSAGNKTIVLTTHMLEEADALADRIIVLHHGQIHGDGTPEEIKSMVEGKTMRCITTISPAEALALEGVIHAKRVGRALELTVVQPEPVIQALFALDPNLSGLVVNDIKLEDAFLALTQDEPVVA